MPDKQPATSQLRWLRPTPGRLLIVLLVAEVILLLSERFQWFGFNEKKGWTVLIAVGVVGLFLLLMLIWFLVSLIFRWHFQFGIRSLLVLTIAVAIPFSWMAVELEKENSQLNAIASIKEWNGITYYDCEIDYGVQFTPSVSLPVRYLYQWESPEPIWLQQMLGKDFFHDIVHVVLFGSQFKDDDLSVFQNIPNVITIILNHSNVTDRGIENLKELKQLQELELRYTIVTDSGLQSLAGLHQLKLLDLRHTQVTDAGVAELQKALPNCKIER